MTAAAEELQIACPGCGEAPLVLRLSCLAARLVCAACRRSFSIESLAAYLDEATFERLARVLGTRLSDRI